MGFGDEILASGMARGARGRGKLAAFGNGTRIIWGPNAAEVFKNNPNIAKPGSEKLNGSLEWFAHYHGRRLYNRQDPKANRWIFNYDFHAQPGELFFTSGELFFLASKVGEGFVLIEPNLPWHKPSAVNKQWDVQRFQEVANALVGAGREVIQLEYPRARYYLSGVRKIPTRSAREAFAILSRAGLFVGHEGGMHHAAAALGVAAVVIFGGFIPPQVTGYPWHANLTGGADEACGWKKPCDHCRKALAAITVEEVLDAAKRQQR